MVSPFSVLVLSNGTTTWLLRVLAQARFEHGFRRCADQDFPARISRRTPSASPGEAIWPHRVFSVTKVASGDSCHSTIGSLVQA